MKARSTVGRQGLTVALYAGLGDVGYASRWALEVRVDFGDVPVAIGSPIAQVVFHTATATSTAYDNRYQPRATCASCPSRSSSSAERPRVA